MKKMSSTTDEIKTREHFHVAQWLPNCFFGAQKGKVECGALQIDMDLSIAEDSVTNRAHLLPVCSCSLQGCLFRAQGIQSRGSLAHSSARQRTCGMASAICDAYAELPRRVSKTPPITIGNLSSHSSFQLQRERYAGSYCSRGALRPPNSMTSHRERAAAET